jgi:hypothetical protein
MTRLRFALSLVILVIAGRYLQAQSITGSIFGSVLDSGGAAVQAAQVKLTNPTTGAERVTQTDVRGEFAISILPPGTYSLTVEVPGFKTLVRKDITLTPSDRLSLGALTLELGTLTEQVLVSAVATPVQTASAERSTAITAAQVSNLTIYGRTVTSLIALSPGVVDTVGANNRAIGGGAGNATNFNVAGNRSSNNNFSIDGVTMSAVGGAPNAAYGVSMESVSEVKVMVSNYQAEFGRLSGGNVQIVTKSGSRDFHGVGMYYMRNEALNANNFFNNRLGQRRPRNRYNAITYSIGGPVYIPKLINKDKQKLFFYWSQEYQPAKLTQGLQYSTVPSALERVGDFSQSLDQNNSLIAIKDPTTAAQFPGNQVPLSRIDLNGQALLKVFPQPNFTDRSVSKGAYNYVTQFSGKDPLSLYTLKLDYNVTSRDTFFATMAENGDDSSIPNGGGLSAPFALLPALVHNAGQMETGHYTHIFSPTLVNEAIFGYAEMFGPTATGLTPDVLKGIQTTTYGYTASQLNPANNPLNFVPGMSFGGVTGAASMSYDGRFPYFLTRYTTDFSDSVSATYGPHNLKAGIFIEHMRQHDGGWATNFNGTFDFGRNVNNPLDTNNPYSNAVLGIFNTYTEATSRPLAIRHSDGLDWFVQDNWKVSRRLTLDYGARFTWWTPFTNWDNKMATFVPGLYDPSQKVKLIYPTMSNGTRMGINPNTGQTYPAALIGFIAPGAGNPTNGMVVTTQVAGYPAGLTNNNGPLVAPRIGFAYDPFGDGKTSVRGGFGMFYNRILGGANTGATYSYPIVQSPLIEFNRISSIQSAQGLVSVPSVNAWQKDIKAASVMNISLSIQRDIGFGTVVDVGYLGSLGRHLTWERDINSIPMGTRFLAANADPTNPSVPLPDLFLRPTVGYGGIGYDEAAGSSNYHSLQVTANRRLSRGLSFGAAWTYSKVMDFNDGEFGAVNIVAPFRAWNYGRAAFDRTHVVKLTWVYNLPQWKSVAAPVRVVVNNWQVSGIATFSTGQPIGVGYSLVTSKDLSGTPSISPRILVIGNPNLSRGDRSFTQAFNTGAFAMPAAGTLGTMSKTLIESPGINNFDVSIFKNIPLYRERLRAQLRGEFYNFFNHTQFSSFDSTARFASNGSQVNAQFGQYTAARDPRVMQLAIRFEY